MSDDQSTKLATGSLIILAGTIAASSFEYGTQIAVVRVLGPTDYGILTLGTSILFGLTTLSVFGMDAALSRYISSYARREESGRVNGTVIFGTVIHIARALVRSDALRFVAISKPAGVRRIESGARLGFLLKWLLPTALMANNGSLQALSE